MTKPSGKDAASALSWQAAQQMTVKLLFLVRTPVLARLLAPEDFGLLAIGLVSLDVVMRITEVGMIPALIQKEDADRRHYDAAWTVGVFRSTLVAAAVFLAAPYIATVFGEPRATPVIQALGARPLLMALASIGVAELTRTLQFKKIAALRLADVGVDAVLSIGLAPFLGVWALVVGSLAGPTARTVVSYVVAPYRPRIRVDRGAASSLIRFGRWIFVSGLIGLASQLVLQAVIARQLGTAELGLYYLAAKIAGTLSEISWELVGSVAFPWFSRLQSDRKETERMFKGLLRGMIVVLLPVGLMLATLAPSIVTDLLGPRWVGTEDVIRVMVLAALLGAFGDAAAHLLKSLGYPNRTALLEAIQALLLVSLVWEGARRFGLVGAAGAWIPATVITQFVAYAMLRREIDSPLGGIGKLMTVVLGISAAGAGVAFVLDTWVGGIVGLLLGAAVGGTTVLFLLVTGDSRWSLHLLDDVASLSPGLAKQIRRIGLSNRGQS